MRAATSRDKSRVTSDIGFPDEESCERKLQVGKSRHSLPATVPDIPRVAPVVANRQTPSR